MKEYIIIPFPYKYNKEILNFFHLKYGHKGYKYLEKDILSAGYYFTNIYRKCKFYTSKCAACTQNKKNNFINLK